MATEILGDINRNVNLILIPWKSGAKRTSSEVNLDGEISPSHMGLESAELKFHISWKSFNDENPTKEPNTVVSFFLLPPSDVAKIDIFLEDEGNSISVSCSTPMVCEKHVDDAFGATTSMNHQEKILFYAKQAAFRESASKIESIFKQKLDLPFKVVPGFRDSIVEINGLDYVQVILTKFEEIHEKKSTHLERRIRVSSSSSSSTPQIIPTQITINNVIYSNTSKEDGK